MEDPEEATRKAKFLTRMAVEKSRLLEPLEEGVSPVTPNALVIGGGGAGMTAALQLADAGFETYLVEREGELGGNMRHVYRTIDSGDVQEHLETLVERVAGHPRVRLFLSSEVSEVRGYIGSFHTTVSTPEGDVDLDHGAIVVATGAREYEPDSGEYMYGADDRVITQTELERRINEQPESLEGLRSVTPGVKMVGQAVTVRTYPGDWAKPVEAIDVAQAGSVIVIDAGGVPPALWGELATLSAMQKELAGVVIYGAARDSADIRELGLPVFCSAVCSRAGEPKGHGEIGAPLRIGGSAVLPGDWIVADDDGVLVLPRARAAEMANRGMDCLETENRIREEIRAGKSTLGQVQQLLRWEKAR
jgi:regulator of RNase E activity RraA